MREPICILIEEASPGCLASRPEMASCLGKAAFNQSKGLSLMREYLGKQLPECVPSPQPESAATRPRRPVRPKHNRALARTQRAASVLVDRVPIFREQRRRGTRGGFPSQEAIPSAEARAARLLRSFGEPKAEVPADDSRPVAVVFGFH